MFNYREIIIRKAFNATKEESINERARKTLSGFFFVFTLNGNLYDIENRSKGKNGIKYLPWIPYMVV